MTGGFDEQRSDLALYEGLRQEDDDSSISEDDADANGTPEDVFPECPSHTGPAHANRSPNSRTKPKSRSKHHERKEQLHRLL